MPGLKDSSDIRRINRYKIQRILWSGGEHTKQQLAAQTGLSVATCNTLLNEMERSGEVVGEHRRLRDVGRESMCYHVNERYESLLCVSFDLAGTDRLLVFHVLSTTGNVIDRTDLRFDHLDYEVIAREVSRVVERQGNVTQVVIGTPSVAEHGTIHHCDLPELEGVDLADRLEALLGIPVHLENDMHLKAYGYYCGCTRTDEVITLANFPQHVLPGTASVQAGTVIKGCNQFAGMVGFLPYEVDRAREIELLAPETCRPFVSRAIASVIAVVNPGIVVLTGNLLNADSLEWIERDCLEYIPREYMPALVFEESFDAFYLAGMYQRALELKGTIA